MPSGVLPVGHLVMVKYHSWPRVRGDWERKEKIHTLRCPSKRGEELCTPLGLVGLKAHFLP